MKANLESTRRRLLDGLLVGHLAVIFWAGYDAASRSSVMDGQPFVIMLSVSSLLCVSSAFYPFSLPARLLWMFGAPCVIMLTLLLGMEVRMRTASTLAFRPAPFTICQSLVVLTMGYLPLVFMFFRRREGWRLMQSNDLVNDNRSLSLKELLAIVSICGATTVLCRQVLSKAMILEVFSLVGFTLQYRATALAFHIIFGTLAVWWLVRCSLHWTLSIALTWWLAGCLWDIYLGGLWRSLTLQPQIPATNWGTTMSVGARLSNPLFQQLAVCCLTVGSITLFRLFGFRLVKSPSGGKR